MDFISLAENLYEETTESVRTPLPDYHLRNPLKMPTWLTSDSLLPRRTRLDKTYISSYTLGARFGTPIQLMLDVSRSAPSMSDIPYTEALQDLSLRIRMDSSLFKQHSRLNLNELMTSLMTYSTSYWNGFRFWGRILLVMNALSSNRPVPPGAIITNGVCQVKLLNESIMIICRTCIIVSKGSEHLVYDGDWVRMVSDVFTQRLLVTLSIKAGRIANRSHYPTQDLVFRVFNWGDEVLADLGNSGFKVIKTYEALLIGLIQTKGESSVIDSRKFLNNTLSDLLSESIQYYRHAEKLLNILSREENMHYLTQLYGLHRVWGHPLVDSGKGMDKIRTIGRKSIIKDSSLSVDAGRMFKYLFSREYKRKFGQFPKLLGGTSLLHTKLSEGDSSALNRAAHNLSEWDRIKFRQTYQLPETFNLSMIIADKAISPTKSELIASIKQKNTVMDPDKRRGVKRWLEDTTLKPKEFLRLVNDGKFPDDHKIIGLTPKERELNPTPRMFSLMSHLMRVYVVVTEQMLSDHVLKMFPQITMTDTLLDLTKKMYSTVRGQSNRVKRRNKEGNWASRVICFSLDFEKWNGHMRKEMTSGVFTSLGDLFGLPELYNVTYDIFSDSYYYLADGSYVPEIIADDLTYQLPFSFTGHQGGMEGLRQKGWTIFTVCCLEVILSKYDCTYKIMGMGDNQVLQITLFTKKIGLDGHPTTNGLEDIRSSLNKIFDDLVNSFTESGLPLKPLETWMSEDLYLYGKVPLWKGVPLTMDIKKLMRTFPMSNEDIMTLENALGTISSNSLAATQSSPCIWTAYVVSSIMTSLCVQDFENYHPLLGNGLRAECASKTTWMLAMSSGEKTRYSIRGDGHKGRQLRLLIQIVPRSLAGYNGMNIYEMMLRGFPDNLSRDLSYVMNILDAAEIPPWLFSALTNWISPIYMPSVNYSTLLEDVTAVNLLSPRAPTSGLRQTVAKYMSSGVKITNKEFKELMSSKQKDMSDYLSECLCEGEELHIRLLHDIYESTIFGYVDSILSKVVKTSTIQKLAIADTHGDVFRIIERDETNFYNYFRWRCMIRGIEIADPCATSRCKIMRRDGWGKELRGVTTPYPASFIEETDCGTDGICNCQDGYLSVHFPDGQMSNDAWNFDIGGNPPYLGSTTKEKVVLGTGSRIYSGEPLVRRPITLLKTINWFVPQGSITARVILRCVTSVTDLDPTPYQGMAEGTAGSEVHRYRDSSTSHGALTSSNFLYSTRYHLSTDNFFRYSKGSENTDIHYQALFCYIVESSNMYISNRLSSSSLMTRFKHYKQKCYACINPIPEDFKDLNSEKALLAIPALPNNTYLFVNKENIRVLEQLSPLSALSDKELTHEQYDRLHPQVKMRWLQDIISDRILADITSSSRVEASVSIGLLDVKSYERTMYLKLSFKYIINRLLSQLSKVAVWSCLKNKPTIKKVSPRDVSRVLTNMLSSADEQSFLGIAMFYCWDETAKETNIYPEMISPSTNPITTSSACQAMKKNLISLANRRAWKMIGRIPAITEDEKYQYIVYKLILYDHFVEKVSCVDCVNEVALLPLTDLQRSIKQTICSSGHVLLDKMVCYPWLKTAVTVERLRKDGTPDKVQRLPGRETLGPIRLNFSILLMKSVNLYPRATVSGTQDHMPGYDFNSSPAEVIKYSLLTISSLPTSSFYKNYDVYSLCYAKLIGKGVLCVGDGLGTSSELLARMGSSRVVCSTLLEPDDAIPQTYVHNTSPQSINSGSQNVDTTTMINKVNNVLDPLWNENWLGVAETLDILVSDIEIITRSSGVQRQTAFMKLTSLKSWELCIVKDYLYSPADLVNRLGVVNSLGCSSWRLVTSKFRSSFYPEVWWILENVLVDSFSRDKLITIDQRNMLGRWDSIREELTDKYNDTVITYQEKEYILSLKPITSADQMYTYLLSWMTFPVVGSLLPINGSYTVLFLYLKRSKRPAFVRMQRDNPNLRLYDSDVIRLRERMFALAVSMLADIDDRALMMRESNRWSIEWEEKSTGQWWCYLMRSDKNDCPMCQVADYIPILSSIMSQQNLLFPTVKNSIKFGPGYSREKLFFPISKNASVVATSD